MYAQFEHLCPKSMKELLALLAEKQTGTILYGGGTDILVDLRAGKSKASRLVDTKCVEELHAVTETRDCISIGCAVTLSEIAENPLVWRWAPALAQGAGRVGSVQIRNKGTLAGNVQTASPAGDALNSAYALDGVAVLLSERGERRVSLYEYVCGPRRTQRMEDELLKAVEIPKRGWTYQRFFKVGRRNALAISVVNGVVALKTERGSVTDARISVGAVAPTPLRVRAAEDLLRGQTLTAELAAQAAGLVTNSVHPISDLRASAEYRAYMAGVMVKRQLTEFMEE